MYNGAVQVVKDGKDAMEFDGVNDYATTPSVNFRTIDFTLAFWIYPRRYGFVNNIINNQKGSAVRQFSCYFYDSMGFSFFNVNSEKIVRRLAVPFRYGCYENNIYRIFGKGCSNWKNLFGIDRDRREMRREGEMG